MPKSKKQRISKTSSGAGIKHRKTKLTPVQKILLGGGDLVGLPKRWSQPK